MILRGNFKHNFIYKPEVKIESKDEQGRRIYSTPDGDFPSVTTVTGWEKRKFFASWRKNNLQESQRVCSRGTTLHSMAEKYILNEDLDLSTYDDNEVKLFNILLPEINQIDEVYAIEAMLWGNRVGLAGRADCIAKYKNKNCIIDFKGSTKEKYKEDIENYFLQATAYSLMWQEQTGEKIPNIVIMMATETGKLQLFEEKAINYIEPLKMAIDKYMKDNYDDSI